MADRFFTKLDGSGPDGAAQQGDDLTTSTKSTLADFLNDALNDPDDGRKYSTDDVFADAQELDALSVGTFDADTSPELVDVRRVINDAVTSRVEKTEILAAIRGAAQDGTGAQGPARPEGDPRARAVTAATDSILARNRFSPGSAFVQDGEVVDAFAVTSPTLGRYDVETAQRARFSELQKVGQSLMLKATGEFVQGDPTDPGVSAASLIPGQAQLGSQVSTDTLRAENAFGAPGSDDQTRFTRSRLVDIIGQDAGSYGQLNSSNEPFNGFLPLGMTGLAVALIVTLRLATTALTSIIGAASARPLGRDTKLSVDRLTLGEWGRSSTRKNRLVSLTDIGIIELDRDFNEAVNAGINVFFDFDGTSFRRIAKSPGYYATFVRAIVRSGGAIIADVVDAFNTTRSGNIVAGAQSFLGVLDVLKQSQLIAFLNIMAQLGDVALRIRETGIDSAPRGSIVDAIPGNNPQARIMKSREQTREGTTSLAWRNSSVPSLLTLPRSLKIAAANRDRRDQWGIMADAHNRLAGDVLGLDQLETTRLTPDQVQEVERRLDSEYVPFYFHDLRTNEFLGFHAFINGVSENFAPSYNSSNPYGRVDPVMTYSNTTRSFSVSFYSLATNPSDFDLMYVKLNKLTTLLYPQWTRGRRVVDRDGNTFTQPFSQLPGASPMIRLRLGDLIKSNFSNISLARLFGLGEESFLSGDVPPRLPDPGTIEGIRDNMEAQVNSDGFQTGVVVTVPTVGLKRPRMAGIGAALGNIVGQLNSFQERRTLEKIVRTVPRQFDARIVQRLQDDDFQGVEQRTYIVKPIDPGLGEHEFVLPHFLMKVSEDEIMRRAGLLTPTGPAAETPTSGPNDARHDFFKPEQNSIVRAFRNVQGKGLPGFIVSMEMDWHVAEGKWDVERWGARAPQMCKIDFSYTVIHDIPPGIDADGYNRAPIYNTGRVMNRHLGDVYDESDDARLELDRNWNDIVGKRGG